MKKMTQDFSENIKKESTDQKELFLKIYGLLEGIYGDDEVDLEAIMSVIAGLKEREHLRENIGELGGFLLSQEGLICAQKGVETYDANILNKLYNKDSR